MFERVGINLEMLLERIAEQKNTLQWEENTKPYPAFWNKRTEPYSSQVTTFSLFYT